MRSSADVMESHDAVAINQYVATKLLPVLAWFTGHLAMEDQLEVFPDGSWPVHVPPAAPGHPVSVVQRLVGIQNQWPWQPGLFDVRQSHIVGIKRDDFYPNVQFPQPLLLLPQLRQMLPASRSAEMPVKNQQLPVTGIVTVAMNLTIAVLQFEWHGGVTCS